MKPGLYVVATPLGNLEDLSSRAIRTLREADVVAAEDTRHSAKLLRHLGIQTRIVSYWGAKEKVRADAVLKLLDEGNSVALVSDAGTPGISDPGQILVAEAAARGFPVVPIPGPSAVTAALSISGISADRFVFAGFLPPKPGARRKALQEFAPEPFTIVFYEAPHRIVRSLEDMADILGEDRPAVVTRELTKVYEETLRGSLGTIRDRIEVSTVAGEYVIVVAGRSDKPVVDMAAALNEVSLLLKRGVSRRDATAKVAHDYGVSRKKLYDQSLET